MRVAVAAKAAAKHTLHLQLTVPEGMQVAHLGELYFE